MQRLEIHSSVVLFIVSFASAALANDANLAQLEQTALKAAVAKVADAVVQIRTVGGLERVDGQATVAGPTTGLIVSPDGYIVSSAFNFAQQPASILVTLPDGNIAAAEIVGRDRNRMLVLLKVEADAPLPTVEAAPIDQVQPGQWAVAVGRTLNVKRVNLSVGVISAVNRMHGRAIQTDANVSAASYGGPLVDIHGRVFGILVPMAPQSAGVEPTNELAGAEYYDSGIGFAIPLEHITRNLERWIDEQELTRGLLGIGMTPGNPHAEPPKIIAVWPRSPAAEAGWLPGDEITAVDGTPVTSQTALRFQIVPRYAGDAVKITITRGEESIDTEVTLAPELAKFQHAFLGVLPERGGEGKQIVVRQVWPASPASKAGVKHGDAILRIDDKAVAQTAAAAAKLNSLHPGDEVTLKIERDGATLDLSATLDVLPTDILPLTLAEQQTLEATNGPMKLESLKLPDLPQEAWVYEPQGTTSPRSMLLWLGEGGEEAVRRVAERWRPICERAGLVLVASLPADKAGWRSDDLNYLNRLLQHAVGRYSIDPLRVVTVGQGKAGQLAYVLAFGSRGRVTGVVAIGAPLPRTFSIPEVSPNNRLAILTVAPENSPFSLLMKRDVQSLADEGHPATLLTPRTAGDHDSIDAATQEKIAQWIDGLDRF